MSTLLPPALWLLVLIVGLPQLSETVYSPALPQIAHVLHVDKHWVEFTLTIYLMGFSIGTLVWGYISDRIGRKPCLILGLLIYSLGCLGCFASTSITALMVARFFQALGGSTGSVLGQAICRESFSGANRGYVFATIGSALSLSPAIGPVIGGLITQQTNWPAIFIFLLGLGMIVLVLCVVKLPETNLNTGRKDISLFGTWKALLQDRRVMSFCCLVGLGNGIIFSYYAEGSFYMIDMLGLSPFQYGLTFVLIAFSGGIGGLIGRRLFKQLPGIRILQKGVLLIFGGTTIFAGLILISIILDIPNGLIASITLTCMAIIMTGISLSMISSLSLALEHYQAVIGTASSLFGFMYYAVIALITCLMGVLHNNTLLPMPIFFLGLGIIMTAIVYSKYLLGNDPIKA